MAYAGNLSFKISVVIPAYNEATRLPRTLEHLLQLIKNQTLLPVEIAEIIVIDDGSHDNTIAQVKELQKKSNLIKLIESKKNYGKGHAVRSGFAAASADWILMADADMSTPWTEVLKLVQGCKNQQADLAIGSRDLQDSEVKVHQSWLRENLGKTFNSFIRLCTNLPYRDTQCGFKLVNTQKLKPWLNQLKVDRFAWDVEFLMRAHKAGLKVIEVPVEWAHQENSRVSLFKDGMQMVATVIYLRLKIH